MNGCPDNLADLGIDDFAPADFSSAENNVDVPENEFNLDEQRTLQLYGQIQPTDDDGNHGINHFTHAVNFIHSHNA